MLHVWVAESDREASYGISDPSYSPPSQKYSAFACCLIQKKVYIIPRVDVDHHSGHRSIHK